MKSVPNSIGHGNDDDLPREGEAGTRDKPLSFHWQVLSPEWLSPLELSTSRNERAARVRESIILDSILEAMGAGRWVSYSRRKAFYAGRGRYHGTDYKYNTVPPAIDALADAGVIDHQKAPPGERTGWQSRFRASAELVQAIRPPLVIHDPMELIRLKKSGRLTDYRDTARTELQRRILHEINESIQGSDLTIDAPGAVQDGPVIRCGDHTLYPAMNSIYRVFNDNWNRGGRLYGGWWQPARKADRKHIKIDDMATVEEDHSQLHPRLLYRMAGQALKGDAYTLPGWPRPICKVTFNVLINAKTYHAAVGAIANEIGGPGAREKAVRLVDEMKHHHQPVARYFHSGIGLRLQNIDAGMAEQVMKQLNKQGVVAFPIHDSFIVQERYQQALLEAMEEAFEGAA